MIDIPNMVNSIITVFGVAMYFAFVVAFLVGIFVIYPARGQEQYTCADVRWAVENLSQETIEKIKAQMTDKQIADAKKCLRRDARRKIPKSN
jgi:hypothetical protein